MNRGAASLTHGHQPGSHRIRIAFRRGEHFAPVIRRDAAHIVVHSRQHRDRLFRDINACEDARRFGNTRQPLGQRVWRQVVQVQMDVITFVPNATPFANFQRHAARHHIARSQILVGWRVAFHEPLALGIGEIPALTPRAFRDQTTGAINARRVELHELHILQRQARPRCHPAAIARAGMRRSGREIRAPVTARRQNDHFGRKDMHRPVVQFPA